MARNYREEIETALAGGAPRIVPFSFYDLLYPRDFDPEPLQRRGMAVCARRDVFRKVTPNVTVKEVRQPDGAVRTIYSTPVGELSSLSRPATLGMAPDEHLIKRRDDYRIAKFIVNDTRYEPIYQSFLDECEKIGSTGKTIAHTVYEPLLDLQIVWIGQEQFCYELVDNEDALMDLHEAIAENHKQMYDVVAASPAEFVLYGGNVVPRMLGPERVRDHVCRCWNAFAERLHEKGKKIGVHLDADNRLIMDTVRDSQLDLVEAFTPPPGCSVSVAEARAAWPGKLLWVNFPASVHLQPEETIRQVTLEIVRQAGDRKGFLMGVTEDIPREHIERSISVILETLESCPLR